MVETANLFRETYSRLEYALKQSGYLQKKTRADADWKAYASDLGDDFYASIRDSGKATALIEKPPKKLMNDHGVAVFEAVYPARLADTQDLLIRGAGMVRNNFYHGDKFVGSNEDQARDLVLITESLSVLSRAIDESSKSQIARCRRVAEIFDAR